MPFDETSLSEKSQQILTLLKAQKYTETISLLEDQSNILRVDEISYIFSCNEAHIRQVPVNTNENSITNSDNASLYENDTRSILHVNTAFQDDNIDQEPENKSSLLCIRQIIIARYAKKLNFDAIRSLIITLIQPNNRSCDLDYEFIEQSVHALLYDFFDTLKLTELYFPVFILGTLDEGDEKDSISHLQTKLSLIGFFKNYFPASSYPHMAAHLLIIEARTRVEIVIKEKQAKMTNSYSLSSLYRYSIDCTLQTIVHKLSALAEFFGANLNTPVPILYKQIPTLEWTAIKSATWADPTITMIIADLASLHSSRTIAPFSSERDNPAANVKKPVGAGLK